MDEVAPVRMDESEKILISERANKLYGLSASSSIRKSAIERIEEELDMEAFKTAIDSYRDNPIGYSIDEVETMLGL